MFWLNASTISNTRYSCKLLSGRSSFIVPEQFRSTVASRPSTGRKRNNRPDDLGEGATQTDAAIRIHGMRSSACFWTMLSRRIFGGCFPWPQKFNLFMVLFGPSDCNVVRVLQETPFRSKSQARSRQHQPTNATSGDQQATETCATMQNGWNGPGFIRAAESQGKFVDNSRDERSRCSIPTQKRRHH